jgi:hypothetical protein
VSAPPVPTLQVREYGHAAHCCHAQGDEDDRHRQHACGIGVRILPLTFAYGGDRPQVESDHSQERKPHGPQLRRPSARPVRSRRRGCIGSHRNVPRRIAVAEGDASWGTGTEGSHAMTTPIWPTSSSDVAGLRNPGTAPPGRLPRGPGSVVTRSISQAPRRSMTSRLVSQSSWTVDGASTSA